MKSITLMGEAGSGKTQALKLLVPFLQKQLPHLSVQPLNDRLLYEEEVKKETAHLTGEKRTGSHSVGYYNEQGELTGFFVPDNEINRRVMRRLVDTLTNTQKDPNVLLTVELGIGINRLASVSEDPYRWTLHDRLTDAKLSGKPLGAVTDVILITAPHSIRWERQQRRPDKTPEEVFSNYSGEGGVPENFRKLLFAHECNFVVIDNQGDDTKLFQGQLVDAMREMQPHLLEGTTRHPEQLFSRKEF